MDGHASIPADTMQPFGPSPQVIIGDCLDVLRKQRERSVLYDAVVSDLPYEIGLHGSAADKSGIAFSSELWRLFFDLLKPGAFIVAFAAARKYHRLASAAEDAGFTIFPQMIWRFGGGLPKPVNVSELFDRDVAGERRIVGYRDGSGFTSANVAHGAQNRTKTEFAVRQRHVSEEAQQWAGYYSGLNSLAPAFEPILLAQRPISEPRMIDNIRLHGAGALNIGALRRLNNRWPTTLLGHRKARRADHGSAHASVKPVTLMEELCLLACPTGGHILDPFVGTGTTGVAAIRHGFSVTVIEQDPELEPVIRRRFLLAHLEQAGEIPPARSQETLPKGIRKKARVTPPEIVEAKLAKNRTKVSAYRSRLADRGLRSVQLWVLDTTSPEFQIEAHRQVIAIAASLNPSLGGDDRG